MKTVFLLGIAALAVLPLLSAALKCHIFEHSPTKDTKDNPKTDTCPDGDKYCVAISGLDSNNKTIVLEACESSSLVSDYDFHPNDICKNRKNLEYDAPSKTSGTTLHVKCCTGDFCNGAVLAKLSIGVVFFALLKLLVL
ncbi:hypothetical protein QR680_013479 [Steinernema hermaphroditum]|uniref:Activin types I and II receptor domain-containing protein n=1 Tax=Steinernema hermaphroditum TaxID=289476 RepID=A0AA39M1L5_9BILA|nr:hypothetical protein QR680_013479 [Steinernema hermaphroditum]